jgi:hypothetical protein
MIKISVDRVALPYKDAVAHFYGGSQFDPNTGVVVGVIDTGVGPHADLNVVGGRNATLVESATQFDDLERSWDARRRADWGFPFTEWRHSGPRTGDRDSQLSRFPTEWSGDELGGVESNPIRGGA